MTTYSKTGCLLLFALALTAFQADVYGAEKKPVQPLPVYRLVVSFDLKSHLLKGAASITLPEAVDTMVSAGNLRITSVSLNGSPADYKIKEGLFRIAGKGTLEIRYEGTFKGEPGDMVNLENAGVVSTGVVSAGGISLTADWYPAISGLALYKLIVLVPDNFIVISEADEITARGTPSGRECSFDFPHPLSGISLVAGEYREVRDSVDGIDIYAYFFPEDVSLAADYIDHMKKYFKMYNKLLVPYPYKRFSVVENILPTGLSMPTFTLLGRDVIRLPFIPETSLGHEITHQWFGNYVFADFRKGNWLEAITTYLSDHLYEEQKGKGWEYRKNILINFQSYVSPEKDFPLRDFMARTGFSSTAIGYGKGAMLFRMLENLVGKDKFYKSLRTLIDDHKFKKASWADVESSFEREAGRDLGWFFSQWLDRKGVPSFEVRYPGALVLKGKPTASFEIKQKGALYRVALPAKIREEGGEVKQTLPLEKERNYFDIAVKESPLALIFDDDYDVMRTLARDEFPPVIARLLGDEQKLIVYSEKEKEQYAGLMAVFKSAGFAAKEQGELSDKDIKSSSLLVLGSESPVLKRLFGEAGARKQGFLLVVRNNPLNASKVVAYAQGDSKEEVDLAAGKIFHYGKYSVLRFEKGKNVAKDIAETSRGMVFNLHDPVEGVEPPRSLKLDKIIDAVSDKPLILIGERHTNYEDHRVELAVIMGLFKQGRKFALGMEMFQTPFQKFIDGYLSGTLDEREFLKKTEYFKRWNFDYIYYQEIIEFARAKGIPIVALNQRSEIVDKVARGGLDALSAEERKEIPQDMDMSDESHKQRMKEVFEGHPPGIAFDNFYQSQILWDETMAHSAARFLEEQPGFQMVVLAGVEHVMYGSGIPNRIHRLTGKDYVTLINGVFDKDVGTYVLFPRPLDTPFSAKLGVIVKEGNSTVQVNDFSPDSLALKAGLKEGDIITSLDGWKIESVSDLKIALFDKKPGQTVSVNVVRKSFFLGERKLEFSVSL
ncbi:MAG: ChaN family lipoprotein [Nitrospirota bacterium]